MTLIEVELVGWTILEMRVPDDFWTWEQPERRVSFVADQLGIIDRNEFIYRPITQH